MEIARLNRPFAKRNFVSASNGVQNNRPVRTFLLGLSVSGKLVLCSKILLGASTEAIAREAMLEVVGVTNLYLGILAVQDVSFVARPGEITGYLGRTFWQVHHSGNDHRRD